MAEDLPNLTLAEARARLFPELAGAREPDEIWPPHLTRAWRSPGAHPLDVAVDHLRRGGGSYPSNRPSRGRPAPQMLDRETLAALGVACPWHQARGAVLNAVRAAGRDRDRAHTIAAEQEPRMRRREAEARRLAEQLRAFIGGDFIADALTAGPLYGALPDVFEIAAQSEALARPLADILNASAQLDAIAQRSETRRAEIASRIDPVTVWKRAFAAELCRLWARLTGARPSSAPAGGFMALAAAAVATLGGDADTDFPLQAQIREAAEQDAGRADQDRFDMIAKVLDPSYEAAVKAPPSAANPQGDDSMFDLTRRIVRELKGRPSDR